MRKLKPVEFIEKGDIIEFCSGNMREASFIIGMQVCDLLDAFEIWRPEPDWPCSKYEPLISLLTRLPQAFSVTICCNGSGFVQYLYREVVFHFSDIDQLKDYLETL